MSNKIINTFPSGHTFESLIGDDLLEQRRLFKGYDKDCEEGEGFVRLNPGGWLYPKRLVEYAEAYQERFQFRKDDIILMTFPKSGTTWTQEILWTMLHNPDLDNPEANLPLPLRSMFFELDTILPRKLMNNAFNQYFLEKLPMKDSKDGITWQLIDAQTLPKRVIKTHLPFSLLPPQILDICKVVYVSRNPKDVIVSYYHHSRFLAMYEFIGSIEEFAQLFIDDKVVYAPYWQHINEAYERKYHKNIHFMRYEDLKKDFTNEIYGLASFLDIKLNQTQIDNVKKRVQFNKMKEKEESTFSGDGEFAVKEILEQGGGFFRKGEVDSWKHELNPEMTAKINSWIEKNTIKKD